MALGPSTCHPRKFGSIMVWDRGPYGRDGGRWVKISFVVDSYTEIQNKIYPDSSLPVVPR